MFSSCRDSNPVITLFYLSNYLKNLKYCLKAKLIKADLITWVFSVVEKPELETSQVSNLGFSTTSRP